MQISVPKMDTSNATEIHERLQNASDKRQIPLTMTPDGKIYLGNAVDDGEAYRENYLIDIPGKIQATKLKAEGDIDKANKIQFLSEFYKGMRETFDRVEKIRNESGASVMSIIGKAGLSGAAGAEAVTQYQNIPKIHDFVKIVTEMYTVEDYTAMMACLERRTNEFRVEYSTNTKGLIKVQKNLGEDQRPNPIQLDYGKDKKDLFADGVAFRVDNRSKVESRINVTRDIVEQMPGAFALAREEKILDAIKTIATTNGSDWKAITGIVYDNDAVQDLTTWENIVKKYGRPIVALATTKAWSAYNHNIVNPTNAVASKSTSPASAKKVTFANNMGIGAVYINDGLPDGQIFICAQNMGIEFYHGPVIQTSFVDKGTPSAKETRTYFQYNGVEVTSAKACIRATNLLG